MSGGRGNTRGSFGCNPRGSDAGTMLVWNGSRWVAAKPMVDDAGRIVVDDLGRLVFSE